MKRIFTLLAAGLICSLGYGQKEQKIHKSNGSILQLPLSDIDSINFTVSPPAGMRIHQGGNSIESVLLKDIDSVTYAGTDWGQPVLVPLAGQVTDEAGQPIQGAVIRAGSLTISSDANGVFYFPAAPVLERLGYVSVSKAGFFPGSRTFLPTQGTNTVSIRLLRKNTAGSFLAASGGTVQAEGVSITFTGGGFVQNGTAFNGQVNVTLNYINPESDYFDSEMPGNLLGIMNGTAKHLTSYGMIAAELTDNAGNKVELAAGTAAQVRFPLSTALLNDAPVEIDLWYFDEATGLWQQEGSASRQGNEYVAAVTHFSFWNCDIPAPYIELKGTVTDEDGNTIPNAKVTVFSPSAGSASDYTSSSGHFGGYVPSGEVLTLRVSMSCRELYTASIGPFAVSTTLPAVQLVQGTVTRVSGTLTDCNNVAISSGYVAAGGYLHFADALGVFSFLACGDSLTLNAYSFYPLTIRDPVTIELAGGTVDMGALHVCAVPGETVTDIDGNVYATVIIGTQEWMAENLKTTRYRDGSTIPYLVEDGEWKNANNIGGRCIYEHGSDIYGYLYNGYAVSDPRNLCPVGWHVPTGTEWLTLTNYVGSLYELKSSTGWDNSNGANESGFTGFPGGTRFDFNGAFSGFGSLGGWWTFSPGPFASPSYRYMSNDGSNGSGNAQKNGFSVRCLRD